MRPFYIFDRWGKQIGTIAWPLQATHLDTINGEDSLSLTLIGDPVSKGQRIVWRDKFEVWHEHTVADTTTNHANGQLTESVYCENSISELLTDILEEVEPKNVNADQALESALQKSRWVAGTVQPTGLNSFSWYHQNAYEAVTDIVEKFGAELSVTIEPREDVVYQRKVNVLMHRGSDLGHLFTYGNNLAGVERVVDTASIFTALYGYGKGAQLYDEETGEPTGGYSRKISFADINGGQAWVGDNDAKMLYGVPDGGGGIKHAFGIVEFSDCEDAEELLELTREALKESSQPKVSYTGNVINLAAGGYTNGEDAQPGDTVYLRDRELDERLQGQVLEVNRNLLDESKTTITLGNIRSKFVQGINKDFANLDWLRAQADRWDEAAMLPDAYLDAVINRLNLLFNTTGGFVYYEKGEGLITYDKPRDQNPTMAIQIMGAGFRIANSKKSDGSWDWRTFGTGDGFTADELTTGIIKGGSCYWNLATGDLLFNQGIIRSADEVNSLNLTTGELQLGHGIIHDLAGNNSWNLDTGELSITSGTTVGELTLDEYISGLADGEAQDAVDQLVQDRLTQKSIFDTLTGGGSTQGLYLQDGRVYINASYIGTGTLQAGRIQDKNNNNYWDLETGELRITPNTKIGSGSQTLSDYVESKNTDSWKTATQRDVFNRLTNDSANQGIYLTGTNLYINATYIKTGEFDADLIVTGRIQDRNNYNFWDLDSGEFRLAATTKIGSSSSNQTLEEYIGSKSTDSWKTANARDVFNKLTNNGTTQGLYLQNNLLYVNANYIGTGTISSVSGGSTWNLNNGLFQSHQRTIIGGQYHDNYLRIQGVNLDYVMDATTIGRIYCETSAIDPNYHNMTISSYSDLALVSPYGKTIVVADGSPGNYTSTYYSGLDNQTFTVLTSVNTVGSGVNARKIQFIGGELIFRKGLVTTAAPATTIWNIESV